VIGEKFAAEGCNIAINYASNKDAADKLAEKLQSEFKVKTAVIQGVRPALQQERSVLWGEAMLRIARMLGIWRTVQDACRRP